MIHYFFSFFLLLIVINSAQASSNSAKNAAMHLPSVVKVKIQRSDILSEENDLIQSDSGGSGFVMDDDNHILTNEHVIRDAKKIFIVDSNNTEYLATLIAKDEKSDIALLEASAFHAPKLPMNTNSTPSLGEDVFVIGAPYSLGSSLTRGVISSDKRSLQNYPYQYFIQTDAAINPGNSGGPIFNDQGEIIGVATMTFAKSGGYTNIGFAIPINEALRIANTLMSEKKIIRGYLGAKLLISDKLSRRLGYQSSTIIATVDPQSPAELGGLRTGDIIIGMNDEKFSDATALHRFLYRSKPLDTLKLSLIRDKKVLTATVILRDQIPPAVPATNAGSGDAAEKLGLIVSETSNEILVTLTHSVAKMVGITSGDTLKTLNLIPVKSIKELNMQLSKLKENDIALLTLIRQGEMITLPIGSKSALAIYSTSN